MFEVWLPLVDIGFEDVRAAAVGCGLAAIMIGRRVSVYGADENLERFSSGTNFRWSFPGSREIYDSAELPALLKLRRPPVVRVCFRPVVDGIPNSLYEE